VERDAKTTAADNRGGGGGGGKLSISDTGTSGRGCSTSSTSSLLDAVRDKRRAIATFGSMSVTDLKSKMIEIDPPKMKVYDSRTTHTRAHIRTHTLTPSLPHSYTPFFAPIFCALCPLPCVKIEMKHENLNGIAPSKPLAFAVVSAAMAVGLWQGSVYSAGHFGIQFLDPQATVYPVYRFAMFARNVMVGVLTLGSGFSGIITGGLVLLSGRIAYGEHYQIEQNKRNTTQHNKQPLINTITTTPTSTTTAGATITTTTTGATPAAATAVNARPRSDRGETRGAEPRRRR